MFGRSRPALPTSDAPPSPAAPPDRRALQEAVVELGASGDRRPVFAAAVAVERFSRARALIGFERAEALIVDLGQALAAQGPGWRAARLATDTLGLAFHADNPAAALAAADAARRALQGARQIGPHLIDVRLTLGLGASGPPAARLQGAELALDSARTARAEVQVFDPAAYVAAAEGLSLMPELRSALAAGEVTLAHQPKYDLRRRTVSGVESLVRWTHPVHGPVSPAAFVAMAEETGDIAALTDYVLTRALAEQGALAAAGHALTFSVNLSGKLVGDDAFMDSVLERADGAGGLLCLEITETAVIERPEAALANLARCADAGIGVAIDDYGAGLSSLAYLKRIPADELKLDRSLIVDAARSGRDSLVIRSTIDLAHALNMTVTAEGVEDEPTAALLAGMGCDTLQGYLFARPMPYADLLAFLDARIGGRTARAAR
jgi:EAL domain-containing protein (putative c-di-GMP-specific phosphodiesterase class I)